MLSRQSIHGEEGLVCSNQVFTISQHLTKFGRGNHICGSEDQAFGYLNQSFFVCLNRIFSIN